MADIIFLDSFVVFDRDRFNMTGKLYPLPVIEKPIRSLADDEYLLYLVGDQKHPRLKAAAEIHGLDVYFRDIFGFRKDGKDKFDFIWKVGSRYNDDRYNWWGYGRLLKRPFYVTDSLLDVDRARKMGVPTIGVGKESMLYYKMMRSMGAMGVVDSVEDVSDIVHTTSKP